MVDTMLAIRAVIPVARRAGKAINVPPPATAFMAPATKPAAATSSAEPGVTLSSCRHESARPLRSAAGAGRAEVPPGARPGQVVGLGPVVAGVLVLDVRHR